MDIIIIKKLVDIIMLNLTTNKIERNIAEIHKESL